jgi:signal transduction histidine kinase/ligand-binding sensor domain-containing protein
MSMKRTIFFLFATSALLCFFVYSTSAQKLLLRRYDVADGLANSTVTSIYQDTKGFIWFSTQEGLSRFDGYSFVNYDVRDGLGHQIVNDVAEDKQGRLWAATNGGGVSLLLDRQAEDQRGVRITPGKKFISFRVADEHGADFVNRIHFDSQNNLWCLTDLGLYRASLNKIANLKFEAIVTRASSNARALTEDRRGRIWAGVANELVEIREGQIINHGSSATGAEVVAGETGERGDFIRSVLETKDGRILVATSVGCYKFLSKPEAERDEWVAEPLALNEQKIFSMFEDSSGSLWFSTFGTYNGFSRYENGQRDDYSKTQGIDHRVQSFAEDNEGNLWFGTSGGGVYKFGGEAFTNYAVTGEFPTGITSSVFENFAGKIVALLYGGQLVEITESRVGRLPMLDGAPSTPRYSFIQARNGEWIWGDGGSETKVRQPVIQLRNQRRVSLKTFFSDLDLNQRIHYYEDEKSVLWLITTRDVYRLDVADQTLSHQATMPIASMLEGSAPQITSDRVGDLWVSSSLGLCRLRERQSKCFPPVDGLPAIDPRALFVDSRGWLWIGLRYNGVSVTRDPGDEQPQFVNYSNDQGMVSNTVWSIAEDNLGRMYFGTERGLEQFDVEKNLWRHFNSKNGLSGDRIHSLAKDRRGNMWICTSSGLTKFNPSVERVNDKPPPIYLSRVNIAGEELPIAETGVNEIPLIELQATRNNLAIEFVGLNFTGEDNLNYQYKLEGVDADWSAPTKQRVVNYARLASGNYRFLVRAINGERITSLTPASFRFRILPPIFMRWWFVGLSILFVGALVVAAYRYRVSRLLELERMRTRIATDLHDDIGSNLTRISLLSELAKQQSGNGKLLGSIADIARESVASMNDIVWAISPQHDRIVDLTRRMRQHAEEVFSLRDIKLEFDAPASDVDIHLPVGTRRDVLLIFKEAVNNTARHSDCTRVVIDFRCEHHSLRLQISDNGSGFDLGSESEGHGLRSMARRASALGGELIIDSHLGEGTNVRFELPVK